MLIGVGKGFSTPILPWTILHDYSAEWAWAKQPISRWGFDQRLPLLHWLTCLKLSSDPFRICLITPLACPWHGFCSPCRPQHSKWHRTYIDRMCTVLSFFCTELQLISTTRSFWLFYQGRIPDWMDIFIFYDESYELCNCSSSPSQKLLFSSLFTPCSVCSDYIYLYLYLSISVIFFFCFLSCLIFQNQICMATS